MVYKFDTVCRKFHPPAFKEGKKVPDTQARGVGVIQLISELGKGLALVVK
jgi:hypothetical protein